jgi:hypothetical protein
MGLARRAVEAIAREHAYRPIDGDVLFVGRQTVYLTPDELCDHLARHGHAVDRRRIEINTSTIDRTSTRQGLVTDGSIFRALGNDRVRAIDVSDYEGAEIIHDLNLPLPPELKGICDFLVDGSTLDNTFNPATTLKNYADLVRPGGRMLLINAFSSFDSAYVIMPPLWYFDYLIVNGFADVRVYVVVFEGERVSIYAIDAAEVATRRREMGHFGTGYRMSTFVFAERGATSTTHLLPTQQHYRSAEGWDAFLSNLIPITRSERPHLLASVGDPIMTEYPGGYRWIDAAYQAAG